MSVQRIYKYILAAAVVFVIVVLFPGRDPDLPKLNKPLVQMEKPPNGVPILTYHKVSPNPAKGGLGLRVRPKDFDWEMHYLKDSGYHTVDLGAVVDHYKNGRKLPEKPIVITFDDGYRNNYRYAYPILKKYGFTATIFVATKTIGGINEFDYLANIQPKNQMLSWNEIKEMNDSGITIGAHTIDHVRLSKISQSEAKNQILGSKEILEKELKKEVRYFCYPYGDCNQTVAQIVKECGFSAATTTEPGIVESDMNPYLLKRICITGYFDHSRFIEELSKY